MKRIKNIINFIKKYNTYFFILLLICIFIIALDPSRSIDKMFLETHDKIKHIFAFFIVSFFFIENSDIKLNIYIKTILLFLFALSLEIVQKIIGRSSVDFYDFLASSLGILVFLLLRHILKKLIEK